MTSTPTSSSATSRSLGNTIRQRDMLNQERRTSEKSRRNRTMSGVATKLLSNYVGQNNLMMYSSPIIMRSSRRWLKFVSQAGSILV